MGTAYAQRSAIDQEERDEYSRTTFGRETVGGGDGGMYYTRPSIPIWIKYKTGGCEDSG